MHQDPEVGLSEGVLTVENFSSYFHHSRRIQVQPQGGVPSPAGLRSCRCNHTAFLRPPHREWEPHFRASEWQSSIVFLNFSSLETIWQHESMCPSFQIKKMPLLKRCWVYLLTWVCYFWVTFPITSLNNMWCGVHRSPVTCSAEMWNATCLVCLLLL
jgi:hypothetical protein